jgi:predicted Zn-dependent peptidase
MINRKIEPELKPSGTVKLPEPELIHLKNGIKAYIIDAGDQDILKLELVFKAGEWYSNKTAWATALNELLDEGTTKRTAFEISQAFDFYGAYLQTECSLDVASVKLFTLTRFANETFSLLLEIIQEAIFPEKEIITYVEQHVQQLLINEQKVDYIARKKFNNLLFPDAHPYGRIVGKENFIQLEQEEMKKQFARWYKPENCFLIVCGKIKKDIVHLIKDIFGNWQQSEVSVHNPDYALTSLVSDKHYIDKDGAVQSAIRIGKRLVNKTHPDYIAMTVFSTILGGYFGSRLMANIREDKGYTYGVGCTMVSLIHAGYFFIATQVGREVREPALKEIYFELERLMNEKVPEEELLLVKNYMIGSFQRSVDGAFAIADKLKSVLIYGYDFTFYEQYTAAVNAINSKQLLSIAQNHFRPESMLEMVVG